MFIAWLSHRRGRAASAFHAWPAATLGVGQAGGDAPTRAVSGGRQGGPAALAYNGGSGDHPDMIPVKHYFRLITRAGKAWSDDYAPSMGAAISYYTVFSLAPLLVIVIAVAGAVFGRQAVQGQIAAQLGGLIGTEGATLVQSLVAAASDRSSGLIAGIVSTVVLLLGATSVFAELQNALDRIWHVPPSEKPKGVWAILRARLMSFGLILGLVFLLMVSLAVSAGLSAFGSFTSSLFPGAQVVLQLLNFVVSIGIATVLFAMIYKMMPSTKIDWRDVWVGAVATAVLFEVGKFLIGLYLGKSSIRQSFAAAGSLVVLIAWVYYAAQIFLLGAEFTKVYAEDHGSRAAQRAMGMTDATAAQGAPAEGPASGSGAAVPVAAKTTAEPEAQPATASPAAARLADTREKLQEGEPPPPVPTYETALAGGSALAGMIAVAMVRRLVHRKRKEAAQPA
jgi:membrane protein